MNLEQFLEEQKEYRKELNSFQLGTVLAVETGVYNERHEKAVEYIENKSKEKDTRLINFVLDKVKEEVEKQLIPPQEWIETVKFYHNREDYCVVCGFNPYSEKHVLLTAIENLKIK